MPTKFPGIFENPSGKTEIESPRKSPICPVAIVTAIPAVNPVTIVYGINFTSPPILNAPSIIKRIPAITVAAASPEYPYFATTP